MEVQESNITKDGPTSFDTRNEAIEFGIIKALELI